MVRSAFHSFPLPNGSHWGPGSACATKYPDFPNDPKTSGVELLQTSYFWRCDRDVGLSKGGSPTGETGSSSTCQAERQTVLFSSCEDRRI